MQMLLFPIFDFFAKNRWAQIVLGIVLTILTLGLYLAWRDNGVRKRTRKEAEAETIAVVNDIERKSHNAANEAAAARSTAPVYPDAASVPPQVADRIFRD